MKKPIDEKGKKYGKLTVLEFVPGTRSWKCQCECGNIRYYTGTDLGKGNVKSCGCLKKETPFNFNDLTGQKFGRLTAISYDREKQQWLCRCECGNEVYTRSDYLRTGHKKSCGCWVEERTPWNKYREDVRFNRLYRIYHHMKERCYREKNDNFKHYGGKGIKVCDEWKDNFGNFFEWAIANGYEEIEGEYKDKLTIDRIDSSKDYSPENCRWVPFSENCSRVSNINQRLEELNEEEIDDMVKEYLEKRIEKEKIQKEYESQPKSRNYFFRKPNYCHLKNKDGSKQYLFKNYTVISMFLGISSQRISYRVRKKDGMLNDEWRIAKLTKEEFNELKEKGVEVIL